MKWSDRSYSCTWLFQLWSWFLETWPNLKIKEFFFQEQIQLLRTKMDINLWIMLKVTELRKYYKLPSKRYIVITPESEKLHLTFLSNHHYTMYRQLTFKYVLYSNVHFYSLHFNHENDIFFLLPYLRNIWNCWTGCTI